MTNSRWLRIPRGARKVAPMPTQCILRAEVARTSSYIAIWPKHSEDSDCPSGGLHSAENVVSRDLAHRDCPSLRAPEAHGWEGSCRHCGQAIPWDRADEAHLSVSSSNRPQYDTVDGSLHPGDMCWVPHWGDHCSGRWTNCEGRHLHVVLPNGHEWDIDSRANNCTLKDDTTHRCWVREGDPPMVTAGKAGHTCTAGAGSIQSGDYHGFLQNGLLTP